MLTLDVCEVCSQAIGLAALLKPATPPPPVRAAAPSAAYLEMVKARSRAHFRGSSVAHEFYVIDVPGIERTGLNIRVLVDFMARQLYFNKDKVRAAVLPGLQSSWEIAEFEQLLCIGDGFAGDSGSHVLPKMNTEKVELYRRGACGLFSEAAVSLNGLVIYVAFTLLHHARAISEGAIPKMGLVEAADLAEALVVAETLVWHFDNPEKSSPWSLDKPTALQRQAWDLKARLWQEWPEDKDFGANIDEKPQAPPTYAERQLSVNLGPQVAA